MQNTSLTADTAPIAGQGDALLSPQQGSLILARLYGEPLHQLPTDLYIPPDALRVFLETFEGPLDLLLYLIRRHHFNILDIPMVEVTRQYLGYVAEIKKHDLELAAEYLLMAAMLIEIKARMLLPIPKTEDNEEELDPRAELVRRLLEYEAIQHAARQLALLPRLGKDFWRAHIALGEPLPILLPSISGADLHAAWQAILGRVKANAQYHVKHEELSVRAYMSLTLRSLQNHPFIEFTDLLGDAPSIPLAVIHFLALLELLRSSLIEITQAEVYAPIYVRLAYAPG